MNQLTSMSPSLDRSAGAGEGVVLGAGAGEGVVLGAGAAGAGARGQGSTV